MISIIYTSQINFYKVKYIIYDFALSFLAVLAVLQSSSLYLVIAQMILHSLYPQPFEFVVVNILSMYFGFLRTSSKIPSKL